MPARGAGGGHAARKSCNCKNSRCLKLYCECFASGRYCENCNCSNCCNNRENEHVRQPAVDAILERNPNAFRPKIQAQDELAGSSAPRHALPSDGVGKHSKGCNCKKSACLKKYCECFQAGVYCSDFCKCADCKNFDGSEQRAQVIACLNMQPMPAYHAPNDFTSPHSHLREPASGVSPLKRPRPNVPPLPLGYGGTPLQLGASSGIVPGSAQAQAAAALAARGLPPLLGGGLNPGNIASALTLPQLLGLSSQQALGNFGGLLGLPQGAGAQAGTSQLGGGAQLPFHSTSSLDAGQEKAVLSETLALLSKLTKGAGQKVGQTSETPPDADRIVAAINQSQQAVQTTQGMTAEQRISQLQQANSAAAMASSLGLPILAPPVMPASTPQGVLGGSMGLLQGTALAGLTGSGVVGTPSAGAAADAASTQQVIAAVAAAAAAAAAASAGDAGAGSAPDAGTGAMPPADALTAMQSLVGLLGPNPMDPSSTPAAVAGTAGSVGPDAGAPAEPVQLPVKLEVNSDVAAS